MSYILDALKKAERERGLAEVPTLETIHDHRTKIWIRPWMVPGLFLLGIIVALWLILPSLRQGATQSPPNLDSYVPGTNQLSSGQNQKPSAEVVMPKDPRAKEAFASGMDSNPVRPFIETPRAFVGERRINPSNAPSFPPDAIPNPQESPLPETSERLRPVPDPPEQTPSAVAQAKPLSLEDAIAGMTMSIHMFSEEKSERMVFINGKKYLEGDHVDRIYLLENITPEGAVLRYGAARGLLRPGGP